GSGAGAEAQFVMAVAQAQVLDVVLGAPAELLPAPSWSVALNQQSPVRSAQIAPPLKVLAGMPPHLESSMSARPPRAGSLPHLTPMTQPLPLASTVAPTLASASRRADRKD